MQYKESLNKRKIMCALMLGVAAGALASILERVDAAITGGNYTPLGYINTYLWVVISACTYWTMPPS